MSCCPKPPEIKIGDSGDEDDFGQDTDILPGESVECYMRRVGDITGNLDDKTEHIPDKIENTDVPLRGGVSVDVQFRLTPNSTKKATTWSHDASKGEPLPPGITFEAIDVDANKTVKDENGNEKVATVKEKVYHMKGTFPPEKYGKMFKLDITADGIDTRNFTFSPAKITGSNEISFVHPLPGARVTSVFGPRRPPAVGASSKHGGVDFSVKPKPPADVLAAADGEVTAVLYQPGKAGKYIKIRHPNANGQELCTTVYMHLADFYVTQGQKVVAGQKIGKEGNTGVGTGPHLHFECRLPNGTKIDPLPYIKGVVGVARETNPDNSAKDGTIENREGNAALTPENVQAKQGGCAPFGPDYPKDPSATNEDPPATPPPGTPPANIKDPFEYAWYFTMTHEVGPHWNLEMPTKPDVKAGKIDTKEQRKNDGYVNKPNFPGGETKFGIAQGPNPGIKVTTIEYDPAKKTGFNNYWKKGTQSPASVAASGKPRLSIMLFDMNYLHGGGTVNSIKKRVPGLDSMSDDQAIEALSKAQQDFMKQSLNHPIRKNYVNGWLKRSRELLAHAKAYKPE